MYQTPPRQQQQIPLSTTISPSFSGTLLHPPLPPNFQSNLGAPNPQQSPYGGYDGYYGGYGNTVNSQFCPDPKNHNPNTCKFQHHPEPCRYFPNCTNPMCGYPHAPPCKDDMSCQKVNCEYNHYTKYEQRVCLYFLFCFVFDDSFKFIYLFLMFSPNAGMDMGAVLNFAHFFILSVQ
jgi:hypothetical protein